MNSIIRHTNRFTQPDSSHINIDSDPETSMSIHTVSPLPPADQYDSVECKSMSPDLPDSCVSSDDSAIPISAATVSDYAIRVRNLRLSYSKSAPILNGLNMQVPRGSIFGLLGPSGCGKTSLIRCLLGCIKKTSGAITVFGKKPGSKGSHIPGSDIGYMPQEISLFTDLTIEETLYYFASLFNLPRVIREERTRFLIEFLALPDRKRLVGDLSGGQMRRVSLATALIHKPPLLILDEPTVGVDPLLRQSIWEHLTELSVSERLTVVITTHYIEEAKGANLVGLMRHGQILVQERPSTLLAQYQLNTLEEVFLQICHQLHLPKDAEDLGDQVSLDENSSGVGSIHGSIDSTQPMGRVASSMDTVVSPVKPLIKSSNRTTYPLPKTNAFQQTLAITLKNFRTLRRNPAYLLFQFLLPTLEVILFCACIGRNLHSIPVAIYNGDNNSTMTNRILQELDPFVIKQVWYDSQEAATEAVIDGHASSALTILPNFTEALHERLMMMGNVDSDTLDRSTIHVYPDMTNQIMALTVYEKIMDAFHSVAKEYLVDLGVSSALLDFPVNLSTPIYGSHTSTFTEFMAPGVILSIAFLAAIPLTAMALVIERKSGLIERTIVAGVSNFQFLLSHLITQFFVLLVQVFLLMFCVFPLFRIPYHGEFFFILLLTVLQSACGMSFGLLVSSISDSENTATMLALGTFYPNLLLSGTVWPTQAMHDYIRYFSYFLPQTLPIEAMRFMISRGWGPGHLQVQLGFLVTFVWIGIFLLSASIIFKYRRF